MSFLICKAEDLVRKFSRNWIVVAIAIGLLVLGLIVGTIVASKDCTCWWCKGRLACLKIVLTKGFFAVFFRFLLNLLLLFAVLCLLSFSKAANYVKFLILFVVGLFVGSCFKIALLNFGFAGLLAALLVFGVVALLVLVAVVLSYLNTFCYKAFSVSDVLKINLSTVIVLAVGLVYVVVATFLIVRMLVVA
ncbi:MAG: hypothetical protein IKC47_00635 [Clostridia bacterium]|nr:hypothetical protein [Clostridia bacterium]